MTYIEKIRRDKSEYYYLTKNIRCGLNKWKKIRIYIGNKKPSNNEINKCTKKIEEKIKREGFTKSKFSFLTKNDAETLQDLKESYNEWLKYISKNIKKRFNEDFIIRFTYHTNAIEGNRLTLRQTALILKDKVIPSGIRAQDYNEAINGRECLEYLRSYKGDLNKIFLEKVNSILTKNTDVVYSGKIRSFDVRIEGSSHIPPKHEELKKYLFNLFKWYNANKNKLHPFELATIMHAKLAWIHPFEDGNGRTARAIMNLILIKKNYPMFFIPFEKKEKYYTALELADNGDYKKYISKMLKLIIEQIKSYGHGSKKR